MQNRIRFLIAAFALAIVGGCASVPMDTPQADAALKRFDAPTGDQAGLYIYRDSFVGQALKKTVTFDGVAIGETANRTYFHRFVSPGKHVLGTESEFSDNNIDLVAVAGQNYYVRQSIKMGVFVGGAKLEVIPPATAQAHLRKCELAK